MKQAKKKAGKEKAAMKKTRPKIGASAKMYTEDKAAARARAMRAGTVLSEYHRQYWASARSKRGEQDAS